MKIEVVIVGAGPSGLATSACLNLHSIPNIVLEREDCSASLWKKKSYDRLKLHLPKQFCQLPHMPYPSTSPTYIPKDLFIQYLDNYESHFKVAPRYCRLVESATYDGGSWRVVAKNTISGEIEEYDASFLVVASGETCDAFVPKVPGLDGFKGSVLHSIDYKSGGEYGGKDVLVVGSGNSGMEIALDLSNHGARTSIVVRSPVHVLSRGMVSVGLLLLKLLPLHLVDSLLVLLSKFKYGNVAKYGITRPTEGPFYLKEKYGKYPVIEMGTMDKIESGEIQVLPALTGLRGSELEFANGELHYFATIIFATGFKRATDYWLKIAIVVFLTATAIKSLSSPLTLEKISTISAAPALLAASPLSSPPDLAPDITPLLPSPSGVVPSPSDMLPTIPSNRSPPNPDEMAGTGLNSAVSPSGSFTAVASTSVAAPPSSAGCSSALCFGLVVFCLLQLLGGFS